MVQGEAPFGAHSLQRGPYIGLRGNRIYQGRQTNQTVSRHQPRLMTFDATRRWTNARPSCLPQYPTRADSCQAQRRGNLVEPLETQLSALEPNLQRVSSFVRQTAMEKDNPWANATLRAIINQESKTDYLIMMVTLACCCVTAIFSVTGNSLVLWTICRSPGFRQSATYIFIANICVSDIFISTLVLPFQFQVHLLKRFYTCYTFYIHLFYNIYFRWLLPWFLCYACPALQVCYFLLQ